MVGWDRRTGTAVGFICSCFGQAKQVMGEEITGEWDYVPSGHRNRHSPEIDATPSLLVDYLSAIPY